MNNIPSASRLVLVTGPSGAGRSTAINVLEDLGFEAIDNLPLSLLPRLVDGGPLLRPLAVGIDARTRDFSTRRLLDLIGELSDFRPELLYVDCRPDVLLRRFSETRRRHPLAPAEAPDQGIRRETDLLVPLLDAADQLIDTSDLSPHDLRAELERRFGDETAAGLAVVVHSFSYKRGLPQGVDMMLDLRFLRNPYWTPDLRELDGRDDAVARFVTHDPLYPLFVERLAELLDLLLPAYREEGKAHFTLGLGCTGGQHRSVAVAEAVAKRLAGAGWRVSVRHRELERRAANATVRHTG